VTSICAIGPLSAAILFLFSHAPALSLQLFIVHTRVISLSLLPCLLRPASLPTYLPIHPLIDTSIHRPPPTPTPTFRRHPPYLFRSGGRCAVQLMSASTISEHSCPSVCQRGRDDDVACAKVRVHAAAYYTELVLQRVWTHISLRGLRTIAMSLNCCAGWPLVMRRQRHRCSRLGCYTIVS
jgi:hypothetical protein